jgi:UDP-galactopyranose mutase
MIYDYIVVGSGLFGSTFANLAKDHGKKCLILEKRNHIGGNVYTENKSGIKIHMYGPHIFHTSNKQIWEYVNKFTTFNNFTYRPKVNYKGKIYSFPINLMTLYQMWGCINPLDAHNKLESVKIKIKNPSNLEEWILTQIGEELYDTFIYGYTKKQWATDPKNLPSFIIKRLPIRLDFNDNYFNDCYQGIPIGGYTNLIKNMIENINIETNVNFLEDICYWQKKCKHIIYTGAIDELFNYNLGELEYRSLKFETTELNVNDFQGNAVINYTDENIPYTRVIEHKHFDFNKTDTTIITKEYPEKWHRNLEKYYPINTEKNNDLYYKYKKQASETYENFIFGGRLACYQYLDMHQVIGQAFKKFNDLNN